jgi:hypothetical protein
MRGSGLDLCARVLEPLICIFEHGNKCLGARRMREMKLNSEELHNLYLSQGIIRQIK